MIDLIPPSNLNPVSDFSSILGVILFPIAQLESLPEAGRIQHCKKKLGADLIRPMDRSGSGGVPSGADGDPLPEKGARQHELHDIRRGGEQAIKAVPRREDQFLSQIFLVPKKNARWSI